jgi:hypothetical protein
MSPHDRPTTIAYWTALALTALVLRVVVGFVLFGEASLSGDAPSYANQARDMAAGKWTYPNFWPAGRSIALAPFFLAFGTSEAVVKADSITIDIGCVLLAAILAHQILLLRSSARLAGWIAAFYPPMVLLSPRSFSMNVTQFFLLGFASLAIAACRAGGKNPLRIAATWFAAGCCLGGAVLTRPSAQSILAVGAAGIVGYFIARRIRPSLFATAASGRLLWQSACGAWLAVAAGVLVCVAPVLGHNASLGAGWVLSVNNELNCLLGNNPYTPHYKTWHLGEGRGPAFREYQAYISKFQGKDVPRSAMVHEAIRYVVERPDVFALRTANRFRSFWGFDCIASGSLSQKYGKAATSVSLFAEAGGYCLLMLFVIAGLFLAPGAMDGRCAAFLIAVALAYQLPYALTHCSSAFHASVIGLLFPFAAVALDEARLGKSGGWPGLLRRKGFWLAVAVFLFMQIEYAYWLYRYH